MTEEVKNRIVEKKVKLRHVPTVKDHTSHANVFSLTF